MISQSTAIMSNQIPLQTQLQSPIQNSTTQIQSQTSQVPPTHLAAQQVPAVSQTSGMVLATHQQPTAPVSNSQTSHPVQSNFTEYTNIQKTNTMYTNEVMVAPGQQYHSGNDIISGNAMPNMYGISSNTTPTSVVGPTTFNASCAPVTHHQERAALQQQLQELYCMPPAPENQEKIVSLQEKLQALQQHETNDQCNGGAQCILQTPMFTAAVVDSPQVL